MKRAVLFSTMGMLAALASGTAGAQEVGRVISSTPVVQQIAVPRQVCSQQPMMVQPQSQGTGGAGAILGAIVGGVIGNQIGHGFGRAAATGVGMVAGAAIGDHASNQGQAQAYAAPQCATQTYYENRTTAWNVTYEYAGKQYTVQMPYDPGPTIRLQVSPMTSNTMPFDGDRPSLGTTQPQARIIAEAPAMVYPNHYPTAYAPAYYAPGYYARPFFYPSFSFGYVHHGGHRHRHRH